ncbi:Moesin/ezrin/radixin-like 2, partial [Fragariocoptes setiger]
MFNALSHTSIASPLFQQIGIKPKKRKFLSVEVSTKDSTYFFDEIPYHATGHDIFERVCRAIGLRETQYFGIQFIDNKRCTSWLSLDKRLVDQHVDIIAAPPSHQPARPATFLATNHTTSYGTSNVNGTYPSVGQHHMSFGNGIGPTGYGAHHTINTTNDSVSNVICQTESFNSLPHLTSSLSHQQLNYGGSRNNMSPISMIDLRQNMTLPSSQHAATYINVTNHHDFHPLRYVQHLQASPSGQLYSTSGGQHQLIGTNGQMTQHHCSVNRCLHHLSGDYVGKINLMFVAKYFPVSIDELIQPVTQHLFYAQVKDSIVTTNFTYPSEEAHMLAALAYHIEMGDCDESSYRSYSISNTSLAQAFLRQCPPIEEKLKIYYNKFKTLNSDEAKYQFLSIAGTLPWFGVTYFDIIDKNGAALKLGIAPTGLSVYEHDHIRMQPKYTFLYTEVKNVMYNRKKFTIEKWSNMATNRLAFVFYSNKTLQNECIYSLCVGYHELHVMRQRPESLEMQQMKAQAYEEKERRKLERARLVKELEENLVRENQELHHLVRQSKEREKAIVKKWRATEAELRKVEARTRLSQESHQELRTRDSETDFDKISAIKTQMDDANTATVDSLHTHTQFTQHSMKNDLFHNLSFDMEDHIVCGNDIYSAHKNAIYKNGCYKDKNCNNDLRYSTRAAAGIYEYINHNYNSVLSGNVDPSLFKLLKNTDKRHSEYRIQSRDFKRQLERTLDEIRNIKFDFNCRITAQ